MRTERNRRLGNRRRAHARGGPVREKGRLAVGRWLGGKRFLSRLALRWGRGAAGPALIPAPSGTWKEGDLAWAAGKLLSPPPCPPSGRRGERSFPVWVFPLGQRRHWRIQDFSSLVADSEVYNKQRIRCAQVGESKKEAVILGGACDDTCLNCGLSDDCRKSHLGEDTQFEYLRAHKQNFEDRNSSSTFSEQRKTMEVEMSNRRERVHEVPGSAVAKEQNLVDMSEDCSLAPENGVADWTCLESAMPELPHLLQDSVSLPDCNGSIFDDEEQTEYHSIECGSMLESHSCVSKERVCPNMFLCDRLGNKEVKDCSVIDSTLPPETTTREVCENNDRHTHSISAKQDNPLLSALDRAPAVAVPFCKHAEHSFFYSCEESGVCLCSAICTECTAKDAESQFPVSAAVTDENPFFEVEVADKSSHGNTSCLTPEYHGNLENILSDSTINQAVDVSSDFRACFTTSRSTSAQVCVSSRAINTEITMMNRSRAMRWFCETCADIACNPDGSCGASSTEEILSQFNDRMEKHSDGNTATAERRSQVQEQQESNSELCSSDNNTDRLIHVDKEAVKNSASSCCQKILQRAIEAELQILNCHYQMCYQHCLKICKPALEENTFFIRHVLFSEVDNLVKRH
ncbi:RNA-binding protein 44-like [Heliangelus exortis]|uniref:RNA-binding protein 44-like n=1 Tax=Heliangelus exortis TaxID=472823 RepID=UPI003A947B61